MDRQLIRKRCSFSNIFNSLNKHDYFSSIHSGGLNPGDIITHINGKEIHSSSDVYEALSHLGKALNITIYRGLNRLSVTVIPEDQEE